MALGNQGENGNNADLAMAETKIINEMKMGLDPVDMKKVLVITDRREAIKTACMLSNENDIILVAGKGHEKYQEIQGIKHPFDDKETLEESFKTLGK